MTINQETLTNDIYNLLLNPEISGKEREVLLQVKNNLGSSKNFNLEIYTLYHQLEDTHSPSLQAFYDHLSEYIREFPEPVKKALSKRLAGIGVIIFTVNSLYGIIVGIIAFSLSIQYYSEGKLVVLHPASGTLGSPLFSLVLLFLEFALPIAYIIFDWLAYIKIDKKHGFGWSIYLLLRGSCGSIYLVYKLISTFVVLGNNELDFFWTLGVVLGVVSMICYIVAFRMKYIEKR